jgi:Caudovirus prohead serine protease
MQKVLFASFQKVADSDDGGITIEGVASTEDRDAAGEIVLASAIKSALPEYRKFPTIREMHALSAAGTALEVDVDDDGITKIVARVVDEAAIKKVRAGVYRGFSIGGKILARDSDDKTIITKLRLDEISLVDRPSNPEAVFDVWKAAGASTGDDPFAKAMQAIDAANRKVSALTTDSASDLILKAFAAKDAEIEALKKRVDELLETPLPPKTAGSYGLVAVSKEEDARGGGDMKKAAPSSEDLQKALEDMDPDERALLLTKAALRLPRAVAMVTPR